MEIIGAKINQSMQFAKSNEDAAVEAGKDELLRLPEGSVIKGQITDITKDAISILLDSERLVTAKLLNWEEGSIGQKLKFIVRHEGGEPVLEMIKSPAALLQKKFIMDILAEAGLKPTEDHIKMAETLLRKELPVDKDTLLQFEKALRIFGSEKFSHIEYLVKNGMKATANNMKQLTSFIEKQNNLKEHMTSFAESILKLPTDLQEKVWDVLGESTSHPLPDADGKQAAPSGRTDSTLTNRDVGKEINPSRKENVALEAERMHKERIAELLDGGKEVSDGRSIDRSLQNDKMERSSKKLLQKLLFNMEADSQVTDLENFFESVSKKMADVKSLVSKELSAESQEVLRNISSIQEHVNFLAEIKNNFYMHIPFFMGEQTANAELFVFKDKRNKSGGKKASCLIALDMPYLGHFETYIQKLNRDVHLQFKIENENVHELVKNSIRQLEESLSAKNYHLSSYVFKKSADAFLILDKEPIVKAEEKEIKRFTFDMRM